MTDAWDSNEGRWFAEVLLFIVLAEWIFAEALAWLTGWA
jgi:hypothetical protein